MPEPPFWRSFGGRTPLSKGKSAPGPLLDIVILINFDVFDQLGWLAPSAPFPGQDVVISHQFTHPPSRSVWWSPIHVLPVATDGSGSDARGIAGDDSGLRVHGAEWGGETIRAMAKCAQLGS